MSSLMQAVCEWARSLPVWEQHVLQRILRSEPFTDEVYSALAESLVEGKDETPVDFSEFDAPETHSNGTKPILRSISEAVNVNALAGSQSIEFAPGLTIIFGRNGSGKSGYARVFGSACFSRGDKSVLHDVFDRESESHPKVAKIVVERSGESQTFVHDFSQPVPELGGFYVFDTTCVTTHLSRSHSLSFSPVGLSALQELVSHTDKVRDVASGLINKARETRDFSLLFNGDSATSREISKLNAKTKLQSLQTLRVLSAEEEESANELEFQLATLKSSDRPREVRKWTNAKATIQEFLSTLKSLDGAIGKVRLEELQTLLAERRLRKEAAKKAGVEGFAVDGLDKISTEPWSDFLKAAKRLADVESKSESLYPVHGENCLLCRQELPPDSINLLHRFWEFLKGEAKQALEEVEQEIDTRILALNSLSCSICEPSSAMHALLSEESPQLLTKIQAFLQATALRKQLVLEAINQEALSTLEYPEPPLSDIEELLASGEQRITDLQLSDPEERIAELNQRLREYRHRQILNEHFDAISSYLERLKWADTVQKRVRTSRHITLKYNELFEQRVTDLYRQTFEKMLLRLGRPLRASIVTIGKKGVTSKSLQLTLPEGSKQAKADPQSVFSEGEKRAVVLADFLTEIALDQSSAGIVLDDPVTSLDAEWKETIASVLVDQARERQVIIFTHDLHFLYLLKSQAAGLASGFRCHWIQRGQDGTPGFISLDNSPASEKDFKSAHKATEYCKAAEKAAGALEQEGLLRSGFGALRTTYEMFVMTDLFGDVVKRFDERISVERLKEAFFDREIANKVMGKIGLLSRFIEGHSHSDLFAAAAPMEVATLRDEIKEFDQLRARLKELKKNQA